MSLTTAKGHDPQSTLDANGLPLTGITVIDLSHVYNGPYATFLMAPATATAASVSPPSTLMR